jgi:hypothetical protein
LLIAERGVDSLDRDAGGAGDVGDRGTAVSLAYEKVVHGLNDPPPSFARLLLAQR